ncbi:uncharacterized protein TNCV_1030001 [Trichonephila clavipes]|nr:uncharacterized protein TNCV_1030001 [Trichonephila clavipes]
MGVCKCIVPSRHGSTLNSRRAASPLARLVVGVGRWEAPDHTQGVLSQNWDGTSKVVLSLAWCSKLRLTMDVYLALCHDEFRGPRFTLPDRGISNNNTTT